MYFITRSRIYKRATNCSHTEYIIIMSWLDRDIADSINASAPLLLSLPPSFTKARARARMRRVRRACGCACACVCVCVPARVHEGKRLK